MRAPLSQLGPDGGTYLAWADGMRTQSFPWAGMPMSSSTLLYCNLASWFRTIWPDAILPLRLFNVVLFVGILILAFRLIRTVFGETTAWIGTTTLAFDDQSLLKLRADRTALPQCALALR